MAKKIKINKGILIILIVGLLLVGGFIGSYVLNSKESYFRINWDFKKSVTNAGDCYEEVYSVLRDIEDSSKGFYIDGYNGIQDKIFCWSPSPNTIGELKCSCIIGDK